MAKHTPLEMETLELLGGRVCLDFVNTVDPRMGEHHKDYIASYSALVHWSRYAGLLTENEAENLLFEAERHPSEAVSVFEQALVLREAIYRMFSVIARAMEPQNVDLTILKDMFAQAIIHAHLVPTEDSFVWNWVNSEKDKVELDSILWPLVHSAIDLLMSPDVKKVKECPGVGDCGWLFLDTSKNGSRMWCSMESCGSRAKMRRQYARKRKVQAQTFNV